MSMTQWMAQQGAAWVGWQRAWWRCVLCWVLLGVAPGAWAHQGSDAYWDVQASSAPVQLTVRWSVALKDVDVLLPLDANADGQVTWAEVQQATPSVLALMGHTAQLHRATAHAPPKLAEPGCALDWQFDSLEKRSDGTYFRAVAHWSAQDAALCEAQIDNSSEASAAASGAVPAPSGWLLAYHLFEGVDDTHRLLISAHVDGRDALSVLAPGQSYPWLQTSAPPSSGIWATLQRYMVLGMTHLWTGYDHMAFLWALVLPLQLAWCFSGRVGTDGTPRRVWGHAVVVPGADPRNTGRAGWRCMLATVTAFTLGHSITLMVATLGWVQVSADVVEPIIALSIGVSACLNLSRRHWVRPDVLALCFGLVHGLGFAGLLQEMQAPTGLLVWALGGFNLGVELGQLAVVVLWVAVSQMLVRRSWYHRVVVRAGSVCLLLVSLYWFAQRVGWLA